MKYPMQFAGEKYVLYVRYKLTASHAYKSTTVLWVIWLDKRVHHSPFLKSNLWTWTLAYLVFWEFEDARHKHFTWTTKFLRALKMLTPLSKCVVVVVLLISFFCPSNFCIFINILTLMTLVINSTNTNEWNSIKREWNSIRVEKAPLNLCKRFAVNHLLDSFSYKNYIFSLRNKIEDFLFDDLN